MQPFLKGTKVNLRRVQKSDADSIAENANNPLVTQYLFTPYPYTVVDALDFISSSHRMHRTNTSYPFGIEHKEERKIVGTIGLYRVDHVNKSAELGFWLGHKYWRQGLTSEAIDLILDFAFNERGFHRIYARVMHPNKASLKLLDKLGFTQEGTMRQAVYRNNEWLDFVWFAMLENEYGP
jgi:RimJ/RimL family protein N-acetyltransferase